MIWRGFESARKLGKQRSSVRVWYAQVSVQRTDANLGHRALPDTNTDFLIAMKMLGCVYCLAALKLVQGYASMSRWRGFCQSYSGCAVR